MDEGSLTVTGERTAAGASSDVGVGVATLLVLGSVIAVPVLVRSLDERSFPSAEPQRLDVMQLVEAHGRDVAQRVFFDVPLEPRKIDREDPRPRPLRRVSSSALPLRPRRA